ncbi:MAG: hypothetical protein AAGC46_12075 [Solirubrobacteraceae bacterium]|nr:hypothetical protein [Patulibacter sp.]
MLLRTALRAAGAGAVLLSVPAAASADPSILLSSGCYVQSAGQGSQTIAAKIQGLAATQSVAVRLTRQGQTIGTGDAQAADASGSLINGLTSWSADLGSGPKKSVPASVEAFDPATGATIAAAPTEIANFDYSVRTSGGKHHWKLQGLAALTGESTYYAHYFNHGKYKGRMKLGKSKGACGYLSITTTHLTPFRKVGRYDVEIEALKKYDKDAPKFKGRVTVTTRYY